MKPGTGPASFEIVILTISTELARSQSTYIVYAWPTKLPGSGARKKVILSGSEKRSRARRDGSREGKKKERKKLRNDRQRNCRVEHTRENYSLRKESLWICRTISVVC